MRYLPAWVAAFLLVMLQACLGPAAPNLAYTFKFDLIGTDGDTTTMRTSSVPDVYLAVEPEQYNTFSAELTAEGNSTRGFLVISFKNATIGEIDLGPSTDHVSVLILKPPHEPNVYDVDSGTVNVERLNSESDLRLTFSGVYVSRDSTDTNRMYISNGLLEITP